MRLDAKECEGPSEERRTFWRCNIPRAIQSLKQMLSTMKLANPIQILCDENYSLFVIRINITY